MFALASRHFRNVVFRRRLDARASLRAALFVLIGIAPTAAYSDTIAQAIYAEPTDRYAHGVLGDKIEWGALKLTFSDGSHRLFRLPMHQVFEDLLPRLHDLDGDGNFEVISVLTHMDKGASLAVFGSNGLITKTPFIGTRNRWLAPVGAGDFLGDGSQLIAYVDRPHLARIMRFWRMQEGQLVELGQLSGLTNHRIGDDFITGGVRSCAGRDEIVTVDAQWQQVMVTSFEDGTPIARAVAKYSDQTSVMRVMNCAD